MTRDPIGRDRGDLPTDPGERVTEWLLERVPLAVGDRLLEVAGGSGPVSSAARNSGCRAQLVCTDIDFSRVLTGASTEASGRAIAPDEEHPHLARITFLAADMQRLPFVARTFRAVVCRWGLMFASDPLRAFREARRVLRQEGRLVFAVWSPPDENPWQSILDAALEDFGIENRSDQHAPGGMFSLGDERFVQTLLADSGLSLREMERVEMLWRYSDFDAYWSIEVDVGGERSERLSALPPEAAAAFRRRLEEDLSPFRRGDGLAVPAVTIAVAADA